MQLPITILQLVQNIKKGFPELCLILFGSKARGTNSDLSDFDIGIYSKKKLDIYEFAKILSLKEDAQENSKWTIDIVDLSSADSSFIRNISKHWSFIDGKQEIWNDLQKRIIVDE